VYDRAAVVRDLREYFEFRADVLGLAVLPLAAVLLPAAVLPDLDWLAPAFLGTAFRLDAAGGVFAVAFFGAGCPAEEANAAQTSDDSTTRTAVVFTRIFSINRAEGTGMRPPRLKFLRKS
jgi:hypothetical protein